MRTRTFALILLISFGVNIIETSARNGFYKGYMLQSVMNKARKRNRTMPEIKKICQTTILNISNDKTIVTERCIKPKIYLTATQKIVNTIFEYNLLDKLELNCVAIKIGYIS